MRKELARRQTRAAPQRRRRAHTVPRRCLGSLATIATKTGHGGHEERATKGTKITKKTLKTFVTFVAELRILRGWPSYSSWLKLRGCRGQAARHAFSSSPRRSFR